MNSSNRRHRSRGGSRTFDDQTPVNRTPTKRQNGDPSLQRFCRRVGEIIETRLTAAREPLLEGCRVAGVVPLSGVKVLMVALAPLDSDRSFDANAAALAAQRAARYFRAEVAVALNRKQAPQIRLAVVPCDWQGGI
jgi:hypothetical protein